MSGIYKEIHWKAIRVDYWRSTKSISILFKLKREYRQEGCRYLSSFVFNVEDCKFFKDKTEEEIAKVSLVGERAIEWEDLGFYISLEELLISIQLRENWLNNLK